MEDVLDLLDSNEVAFANAEAKKDNARGDKVSLYNSTAIAPVKIDTNSFITSGRTFAVRYYTEQPYTLPADIKDKFIRIASSLFNKGYKCRAVYNDRDPLLMDISKLPNADMQWYLPWKFKSLDKGITVKMDKPNEKGYGIAFNNHKIFMELKEPIRALLAAEVHMLLGPDAVEPLSMYITYSPNGAESFGNPKSKDRIDFKDMRNLVFSYRIAKEASIPIYNLKNDTALDRISNRVRVLDNH